MDLLFAILGWCFFGLIVGAIARLLVPGRQAIGIGMTILVGVTGSFVGGFIAFVLFQGSPLQPSGWILSTLGAVLLLALFVGSKGRRRRAH